ncbi:EamA family transporter [Bacillus sp. FJAT-49731]|nr:EamA family transporter [Lederbergia citrea]
MHQLKYLLFILVGASSYGISASMIKRTIGAGFSAQESMGGQYLFGFLMLAVIFLFTKKTKMTIKQSIELLLVGMVVSLTSIFYALCLRSVPASLAVVLLFQFTWIGILIEAIYLKKRPSRAKLIAILLLWIGTLLSGGIGSQSFEWSQNIEGIVFGLLSAISFAIFFFISGKVGAEIPAIQRSTVISAGGLLLVFFTITPLQIMHETVEHGLWEYGILQGIFGIILPVVFFALGTPKIDSGTATIAGAAELPAAIFAAMLILGESISIYQTVGIVIIIIGVAVPQINLFDMKGKWRLLRG